MKYHFVEICINSYDIKRLLKFNELEYREIKISNNEATFLINKKYLARLTEKCEKYNIEIKNVSEIGNINKIKKLLKHKTTVFTGQTGAGKSSLMNKLDKSLNFETNEISKALGRGKHTTRTVSLVEINNGKVLDTPGFSDIDLSVYKKEDIRDSFKEFKNKCKYTNCMHINEKECVVKELVNKNIILKSRYENYIKFIK